MKQRIKAPRSKFRRRATEIHEDSRTRRVRSRADQARQALEEELEVLDDIQERYRWR